MFAIALAASNDSRGVDIPVVYPDGGGDAVGVAGAGGVGAAGGGVIVPVVPPDPAAAGVLPGGAGPPGGAPAAPDDIKALIGSVRADLERMALDVSEREKGKDKKHKKRHSHSSRNSSSHHSHRSHSHKSKSSSSSSSRSSSRSRHHGKKHYRHMPKWKRDTKRKRSLSPDGIRNLSSVRLRNRADLQNFATRYRGCLAAQFLIAVHNALSKGNPSTDREMMAVDLVRWSQEASGLKELRDLREIQSLCLIMSRLNQGRLEEAADAIAQRVKGVLSAKAPKGTWERAQLIELLPVSGGSIATAAELSLTGLGV